MARLNKKWKTLLYLSAIAVISVFFISTFFTASIKHIQADIVRSTRVLEEEKALLAKKSSLQAEWEAKKDMLSPGADPDSILNAWTKDLLAFAQAQALVLEKIEPAGVRTGTDGKTVTVFISFQGNIRQLAGLVYRLAEKDPLVRIESFDIRREEESKNLSFELLLGKAVR